MRGQLPGRFILLSDGFYQSSWKIRIATPEIQKIRHEYEALTERASQGRRVPVPALLAVLATLLVGVLDECIQAFLPNRVFDPHDILFNVVAGVMAIAASLVLAWVRRWRGKAHPG